MSTAPVATNCLSLGCHTITLTVSDGTDSCTATLIVCAIAPSEAVDRCITLVDTTNILRKNKRPIIASLKAAGASFDRGNEVSAMNQLEATQHKISAQVSKANPNEGKSFIDCIQHILDAVNCAALVHPGQ